MRVPGATTAAVASGHPHVTDAACELLRAGGNAFDAVVGAAFAAAVAEPGLTSLGGGGFCLARATGSPALLFDFFVDTPGEGLDRSSLEPHFVPVVVRFPGASQAFNAGNGSAAVPGNLRGYLHVQRRLGRLPLAEVLAPAMGLARDGLLVNERQGYFLDLLQPIMTLAPAGRALFAPGGRYLGEGDEFRNADLASFLETLPAGGERELYEGTLARRIARDMRESQGVITETDLRRYRVAEREPLAVRYRERRVLVNPAPSHGGPLLALALQLFAEQNLAGVRFASPQHVTSLVVVQQEVERRREQGVLSSSAGTTHISVCDAEGNAASLTSSNGEGSGYVVPGTGIMLNNMLGEDDLHPQGFHASPPGQRVPSMMCPSLVLEGESVALVVGSGGSKRIRSTLLQVICDVFDFGLSVRDAIEAPRAHWDGEHVQVEPGYPEATLAALEARWPTNRWSVRDVYFGGAHAVSPQGEAAGDPRRGGASTVLE